MKRSLSALLNAGFLPEPLDAPYPTAFARRVGEKCLDSLLLDVRGEPVLVRIVPEHTPLPALTRPTNFKPSGKRPGHSLRMHSPKFSQTPSKPQP